MTLKAIYGQTINGGGNYMGEGLFRQSSPQPFYRKVFCYCYYYGTVDDTKIQNRIKL